MKVQFKSRAQQAGFTLIELIVVIVILGIMAATALPKFADLGADARVAKMQAALAAMKAASATTHAVSLAKGNSPATVSMEGTAIDMVNGYPSAGDMMTAAGLAAGDYTEVAESPDSATVLTLTPDSAHADCKISYTEAAAGAAPTFSAAPALTDCD